MLYDLTTDLISKGDSNDVLTDPLLTPEMATQPISSAYLQQIRSLLNQTLDDDDLLLNWFAQFMTQPKYPELVDETWTQILKKHIVMVNLSNNWQGFTD